MSSDWTKSTYVVNNMESTHKNYISNDYVESMLTEKTSPKPAKHILFDDDDWTFPKKIQQVKQRLELEQLSLKIKKISDDESESELDTDQTVQVCKKTRTSN